MTTLEEEPERCPRCHTLWDAEMPRHLYLVWHCTECGYGVDEHGVILNDGDPDQQPYWEEA